LVAVTDSGTAHSFSNPSITTLSDREITRTRPRKKTAIVSLDYPFKVLTKGETIIVQGFDDDTDVTGSGTLIGFNNTGDGYSAIVQNGNTYLFDVSGDRGTQSLSNGQFIANYVPSFNWYGSDKLYATQTPNISYANYVYTPTVISGSLTWSAVLTRGINNYGIFNYNGNTNPFSETETFFSTWTQSTPSGASYNCRHNYTINREFVSTQLKKTTHTFDYYDKKDELNEYYVLNKDGLTEQLTTRYRTTEGDLSRTVDINPKVLDNKGYSFVNTTIEDSSESVTSTQSAVTLSYASSGHSTTVDYQNTWSRYFEQNDYTYNTLTAQYFYPFTWTNTPRGGSIYDNIAGTPYQKSGGVILTSKPITSGEPIPDWTLTFPTYYWYAVGGLSGYAANIWTLATTNADGVLTSPIFNTIDFYGGESVADNLTYDGIPLNYPRATQPVVGTPVETNRWWNGYWEDGQTVQEYESDEDYHLKDYSTNTTLIIDTDVVTMYWYKANKFELTTTRDYAYNVVRSDGTTLSTITTPNTETTDRKVDNPNTSLLTIKIGSSTYEIKDFTESGGFNFDERFFFRTSGGSESLSSGSYSLNSYQIGIHSNNKGNYQKVLKRLQSNSVGNPSGTKTYHPMTPFNASGQSVEIYHIKDGETIKYSGTVSSLSGSSGSNSNGEEWTDYNQVSLSVNSGSASPQDFYCWANVYDNAVIIVPSGDHTISLLKYIEQDNKTVNMYESGDTIAIAISKKLTPDNLDGEEDWYADVYEFNTTEERFERLGNESGALSEINGTDYDFVSYYPV
jgi:hypothetical protein